MSFEEQDKEKVFMLEQQNKALAQQYFGIKEENNQLHIENERHCIQLKDIQSECYSYQTILQMIYSQMNKIIKDYLSTLGLEASKFESQEILDLFGNDVLSDEAINTICSSFITPHDSSSLQLLESSESDAKRLRLNCDQANVLMTRLMQLENAIKGNPIDSTSISLPSGQLHLDALRSALVTAGGRMNLLLKEISGLKQQLNQLEREKAKWQVAPAPSTETPSDKHEEIKHKILESPLSPKSPKSEPETKSNESNEEYEKQIRALTAQVESREEVIKEYETTIQNLESTNSNLKHDLTDAENAYEDAKKKTERENTNYMHNLDELNYKLKKEEKHHDNALHEMEMEIKTMESKLEQVKKECEEEKTHLREELSAVQQHNAQLTRERNAFETKLKRRKLFGEVLEATEHVISKLKQCMQSEGKTEGQESARIEILKTQLKEMSEAFRTYEATLHKIKKLVIFGDKKNDQLASEFLELQKSLDDLKKAKEEEEEKLRLKNVELTELTQVNSELRYVNEQLEKKYHQIMMDITNVHDEVITSMMNEESYESQLNKIKKENEKLKKENQDVVHTMTGLRKNMKRDRFRFEQRLLNIRSEDEKEVIDLMQDEMRRYRSELLCPLCKTKPKDCILTRCQHIFCKDCIEERIAKRERKCPRCLLPFGVDDVKRVWIINDPQLYEDLKADEK